MLRDLRELVGHLPTASRSKRMLYDFLNYQNGIKENSIHATYLLYGQRKAKETQTDGDVEMGGTGSVPSSLRPGAEANKVVETSKGLWQASQGRR